MNDCETNASKVQRVTIALYICAKRDSQFRRMTEIENKGEATDIVMRILACPVLWFLF